MRINTNVPALISYNALTATNKSLQKSIERLSTGLRVNSAADDAAGLAISEKMRAQYRGLDQATSNAQDGISMIQTAEGALNETHSILQRMRELSVQAANDTLTQEDRSYIQLEIDELTTEIDRISTTTQFNKKQLLDGSAAVLWSSSSLGLKAIINGGLREIDQFGQKLVKEGNFKITMTVITAGVSELLKTDIFKLKHSSTSDPTGKIGTVPTTFTASLYDIDKFWDANGKFMLEDPKTITITRGDGAQGSFTIYSTDTIQNLMNKITGVKYDGVAIVSSANYGTTAVKGTIEISSGVAGAAGKLTFSGDEDILKALSLNTVKEATENTYKYKIENAHTGGVTKPAITSGTVTGNVVYGAVHKNVDFLFKLTAAALNAGEHKDFYLHLADNTTVFQIGANQGEDMGIHIGDMSASALGVSNVQVMSRELAARSITVIDNAINRVSMQRARLGAYQNRLEHTINNLTTASTNLKSAESRIRDADMAKEMMTFTKLNVLSQAGNAMLAQANQLPSNVLTLLR
jgi:flagellin